jgi:hypothetical protein
MLRALLLTVLLTSAAVSRAQSETPAGLKDDVPLETYLDALAQIAPAAREGASTYLDAYRRRCGRSLRTIELRQAVAEGTGDAVLMAMMRAAALRDTTTLQRLSGAVSCMRGQ